MAGPAPGAAENRGHISILYARRLLACQVPWPTAAWPTAVRCPRALQQPFNPAAWVLADTGRRPRGAVSVDALQTHVQARQGRQVVRRFVQVKVGRGAVIVLPIEIDPAFREARIVQPWRTRLQQLGELP